MKAIEILFPVIFMIGLGYFCKVKNIVTNAQKDSIKHVLFDVVLPLVVFNAVFTSKLDKDTIFIVIYAIVAWSIAFLIGKLLKNWISERYEAVIPYMLWTVEGGSVALPLYSSIVGNGYAFNTIRFDMAGIVIGFIFIPILVAKESSGEISSKELIHKIMTNSFVLALLAGLLCNIIGLYGLLERWNSVNLYVNTMNMASSSLTSMILFTIGHELKFEKSTFAPIMRLIFVRVLTSAAIVAGIFILFPKMISEKTFMLAVLVYFSCPTGFANQLQVQPLFKNEKDGQFLSTYISLYMLVTLLAYMLIVTFVA